MNNTTRTRLGRKLLSWLLVFVMAFSALPAAVFAEDGSDGQVSLATASADYDPNGTTFTLTGDVEAGKVTISYSAGRFSGDLESGTDYSVDSGTVTILSTGSYNKLGQDLTVSYDGTELGTITIRSSAAVTLENDELTLTGGNGETVADYIAAITAVTIDGTEYPTVARKGVNAHEVYQVSEFFNTDGSVNFASGKFDNGAEVKITANGFDDVTGTVGGKSEDSGGRDEDTTYEDGIYVGTATVQSSGRFVAYDITVVVTVSDGKVTSIEYSSEIDSSNASFATKALQNPGESTGLTLADQINSGSTEVDAVSGATCSSEAVWTAVQDALDNGPATDPRSFVLTPAIYNKSGTIFTIGVKNPQNDVNYADIVITYSMGKTKGTFEKGTDYTAEWDEGSDKVTVTILPTGQYNKLGQLMTVSCAGTSVGSLTIKSGSTVAIADNRLTVTGSETLADYFAEITSIVIDGTSYSIAGTHGATPIPITEFFDEDGSVNFNSDKFANGAEGSYKISIEANGFDMIVSTVGGQSGPVAASNKITVPQGLADGNYAATVKVDPDDATDGSESFDFYNITVTVTVKDGKITNIAVSGAEKNNAQYSHNAELGIGGQITGKGAGDYDVDTVSMATCSSVAIIKAVNEALQGEPAGNTTLTLSKATYEPAGTPFFVTVTNPEEGVDYSEITLSYAAGKFSEALTADGYTVELVSQKSDSELVYKVTVLNTEYIIDDDSNSKYEPYNELGRQLDVTVAGTSAGRVVITSSAAVGLENNQITLTGGNGETLADYLEAVEAITISYTDENGQTVENRYAAKVEHDIPVEYYPTEIFDADSGKVNFACGAFVYGETGSYKVTVETMNDCFEEITGIVGPVASDNGPSSSHSGSSSGSSGTYTVSVESAANGSVSANVKSASKGTAVTVTVKPSDGYELDSLNVTDKDGGTVKLTRRSDTQYTFTMPASKVTVTASFTESAAPGLFTDVASGDYYYDAVEWAVEQGITSGTSAATFSPDASCTRAQAVTFLWRAAGSPAPKSSVNPFTDVAPGDYFYDAVLWAVEQGITAGTTAATFSPNSTVTRAQTVTFLSRAAGSPAAAGGNSFEDVAADAYYASAVNWAVSKGITAGTSAATFSPDASCTRAQIVTFLYHANH